MYSGNEQKKFIDVDIYVYNEYIHHKKSVFRLLNGMTALYSKGRIKLVSYFVKII